MNSLVEKVKEISDALETGIDPNTSDPFVFNFFSMEPEEMNLQDQLSIPEEKFPIFFLARPLRVIRTPNKFGTIEPKVKLSIAVLFKSKLHHKMNEREDIVSALSVSVDEIVRRFFESDYFEIEGEVQSNEVFNDFDFNADGWYLNITVKVPEGEPCLP
ncbi:MAG TPA: hypothetical protein PK840_05695 [Bacilli bacterium]|nr:hypothetical protein [Bacilli bacterium]